MFLRVETYFVSCETLTDTYILWSQQEKDIGWPKLNPNSEIHAHNYNTMNIFLKDSVIFPYGTSKQL